MKLKENINLQALNTLAVSSHARYFFEATKEEDIQAALDWAKEAKVEVYVLGGGSNVLLKPQINGLLILPRLLGIRMVVQEENNSVIVTAGAGEVWHNLVQYCLKERYYGIENLSLIPGLVGAAPIQNIGAYGVELSEVFHSLRAINRETGKIKTFNLEDCKFSYRDSVFKGLLKDKYIILEVSLRLSKCASASISYPALQRYFKDIDTSKITPEKVSEAVVNIRCSKLPDPKDIPNVGSFFKNPIVSDKAFRYLSQQFEKLVAFDYQDNKKKLAAGWLIETAGFKGNSMGGVNIHSQQALVLTNPERLSYREIVNCADQVQARVKSIFGIQLEIEPQVIG